MVKQVERISDRTTDEASSVSAAAEEQTASLNEVTGRVRDLSGQSEDLQRLLDEFRLGTSAPSSAGGGDAARAQADGGRGV